MGVVVLPVTRIGDGATAGAAGARVLRRLEDIEIRLWVSIIDSQCTCRLNYFLKKISDFSHSTVRQHVGDIHCGGEQYLMPFLDFRLLLQ